MSSYEYLYNFKVRDIVDGIEDIKNLTNNEESFSDIKDIYARIEILATALKKEELKVYAQTGSLSALSREERKIKKNTAGKGGLKNLVHDTGKYTDYIQTQRKIMCNAGLKYTVPDLASLPRGSFYIKIGFTLKKPLLSSDDTPMYILDNPVKKDKVFKVPMFPASGWKGCLRWTSMKIFLQDKVDELSKKKFAEERFRLALLFGAEKDAGQSGRGEWVNYLNDLKPENEVIFKEMMADHFNISEEEVESFGFQGRLHFYTTFFDKMDLTVINPHSRKTKAGENAIWLECVPAGAKGTFNLLYVPYDLAGKKDVAEKTASEDLKTVLASIKEMLWTYGFSAKKSSGYGTAENEIEAQIFSNTNIGLRFSKIYHVS